jgi:hypothetical protein
VLREVRCTEAPFSGPDLKVQREVNPAGSRRRDDEEVAPLGSVAVTEVEAESLAVA